MKCGAIQDFKKSDLAKTGSFAQENFQSEVGIAGIRKGKAVVTEYWLGSGPGTFAKHFSIKLLPATEVYSFLGLKGPVQVCLICTPEKFPKSWV